MSLLRGRRIAKLIVNFAMADTGWPHFIGEERFGMRFREVMERLDDGKRHYDVVLPAQLGYECCFGKPVCINGDLEGKISEFLVKAGLDRPCIPPKQEAEIAEFLKESRDKVLAY